MAIFQALRKGAPRRLHAILLLWPVHSTLTEVPRQSQPNATMPPALSFREKTCPGCGATCGNDALFCAKCGKDLANAPRRTTSAIQKGDGTAALLCVLCGRARAALVPDHGSTRVCSQAGHSLRSWQLGELVSRHRAPGGPCTQRGPTEKGLRCGFAVV